MNKKTAVTLTVLTSTSIAAILKSIAKKPDDKKRILGTAMGTLLGTITGTVIVNHMAENSRKKEHDLWATDIEWDTDGNMDIKAQLPKEIKIPKKVQGTNLADYLSNETGYCVSQYALERR